MRHAWSESIKGAVRPAVFKLARPGAAKFRCPICRYYGPMKSKRMSREPDVVRLHSKCPKCAATERHRAQSLFFDEWLPAADSASKSFLHVAPERCLQDRLREAFGTYHTTDLFRTDVDYQEDLQSMSFADASYDVVFVSRVLTIPPDLGACVREMRRVLKPGGVAIVSECYYHETTQPDPNPKSEATRSFGVDLLDLFREHFGRVETVTSDRFPQEYQLINRVVRDGRPFDEVPEIVREPGAGMRELLVLAYADASSA